ncbi:MAG: EamA family transporter [Pontiellaceae bacterium]|nr:EamA family transporter [Pontiellaceae bacterium]MBN2784455.1 EamA family transporter [Pontiellaceae bacterium]
MFSSSLKNNLLAALACLLWSTAFVTAKHAMEYQEPLTLAGLRFILAGLIQIPFCKHWLAPWQLMRREFVTVLLVSLFHTVYLYATFFIGLSWLRGAEGAITIGAGPLCAALVAHFMMHDDRLQRRTLISIAFGMSGILLISIASKPWSPVGLKELFGMLLLLSGSVVSAIGNVVVAKRKGGLPPIALNSAQMLIGGTVLMLIALVVDGVPNLASPAAFYGQLFWLATISAVAFAIWFHLLGRIKVSRLNLWKFLIPLSGALLSWWLLPEESPSISSLAGMALIVAGIVVAHSEKRQKPTA